jgi:hypothetical protein
MLNDVAVVAQPLDQERVVIIAMMSLQLRVFPTASFTRFGFDDTTALDGFVK